MIKSVYVNGLKSLNGFKLDLISGLNVLVGPNGSGKSNILTAFELISKLSHLDTLKSTDRIGSTTIEELFDELKTDKKIYIEIKGERSINIKNLIKYEEYYGKDILVEYVYGCTLNFDARYDQCIYFSEQNLEFKVGFGKNNTRVENFSAIFKNKQLDVAECDIFVGDIDKNFLNHIDEVYLPNEFSMDYIKRNYYSMYLQSTGHFLKHRSLIHGLSKVYEPLRIIQDELESGKIYNMDPFTIRHEIGKIREPTITHDGRGLLATLLEIYENLPGNADCKTKLNYEDIYETIIYFLKKVSPQINGLSVNLENLNGQDTKKIVGKILFGDEIKISIEQMSDGVLKWLSLITALLTTENLFVLEEPENYFHPKMQQLVIDLMRQTTEVKENAVIFSTHSETTLNMLDPQEVIVTVFENGKTLVKRIDDPEDLEMEIRKSGFGLGWYYVHGSLDYDNIC